MKKCMEILRTANDMFMKYKFNKMKCIGVNMPY